MRLQKLTLGWLALLFFISGVAALIYQVIWQRMLGLFAGVDVYSATITVAAFMLGMGAGSLIGGGIADRLRRRQLLLYFAIAECGIALFALISKWFFYDVLYQQFPGISASLPLLSTVLFFSVLLPTFLMGVTLPLLSRAVVQQVDHAASRIGTLYALNTLGAACGALLTTVVLIRHFGFEQSLQIGAALNLFAMAGALILLGLPDDKTTPLVSSAPVTTAGSILLKDSHYSRWLMIYALSGFVALGLEVMWFRMLGVMLKATAFTFGIVLFIYLLGLGLGTLAGLRLAPRSQQPRRVFLICQAGISLYAVLSLSALLHYVDQLPWLSVIWKYFESPINFPFAFSMANATPEFIIMYFGVAPFLVLPATFLMGFCFPYLQQVVQSDVEHLGKRVGWLQTANIVGSTLGALIVGLGLLHVLGTPGTLMALTGMSSIYLLLLCAELPRGWWRGIAASLTVSLVIAALWCLPDTKTFWAKMYGLWPNWHGLYAEDRTGVAYIKAAGSSNTPTETYSATGIVYISGAAVSEIPFGGQHTILAVVPTLLHPHPEEILIIGFGSGDSAYSAGSRPDTRSITTVEILAAQVPNLKDLHQHFPYPPVDRLFSDPRFHYEFTDARSWLMQGDRRFDMIEADPLRINMAYAGNLYSKEYFELVKQHLKPGGYAVSWSASGRTQMGFRHTFPHVVMIDDWILIGSNEPIVIDEDAALARARSPEVQAYFRDAGVDAEALLTTALKKITVLGPISADADMNSDLFPKDEFEKP